MSIQRLDIPRLERALKGRRIGGRILYHGQVGSTMDEARLLAEAGEPEGTVIIAEEQTAGRGRFNRAWVSPPGENLAFSVVLRPAQAQLRYVNMAATLAVAGAAEALTGLQPTIKWPNDVRLGGRKLSGILIETSMSEAGLRYAVLGIGLNVNMDPSRFPEIAQLATSLLRETGRKADRTRVLQEVLARLDDLYQVVQGGGSLLSRWASRLETLGKVVQVRWRDQVLEGQATGVDDEGNLLLRQPDGSTIPVVAGEVTLQSSRG